MKAPCTSKTRVFLVHLICTLLLVSVVITITLSLGSIRREPIFSWLYLVRFDVTNLLSESVLNGHQVNIEMHAFGMPDVYQIGLWNYCKGTKTSSATGTAIIITHCFPPQIAYWFDPQAILLYDLLRGGTVSLPAAANIALRVLRTVFWTMARALLAGSILAAALALMSPLVLLSRWWSAPAVVLAVLAALALFVAALMATLLVVVVQIAVATRAEIVFRLHSMLLLLNLVESFGEPAAL